LLKSTKDNLDAMSFCKSIKSFHSYNELNQENAKKELTFMNYEINEPKNECKFLSQCGGYKFTEQTASPVKTKFERPIILMSRTLKLDE
jgi:hypothetical protein